MPAVGRSPQVEDISQCCVLPVLMQIFPRQPILPLAVFRGVRSGECTIVLQLPQIITAKHCPSSVQSISLSRPQFRLCQWLWPRIGAVLGCSGHGKTVRHLRIHAGMQVMVQYQAGIPDSRLASFVAG
jgi:hypothetical protein